MTVAPNIECIMYSRNACRDRQLAVCATLDAILRPIADNSTRRLRSEAGSSTSFSGNVQCMQTLMQDAHITSARDSQSTCNLVAVLHTLTLAAQSHALLSSRSPAMNQLFLQSASVIGLACLVSWYLQHVSPSIDNVF